MGVLQGVARALRPRQGLQVTWGKGIVVCSGGIDSVVLLHWLASFGAATRVVFFDYGQVSAGAQWDRVKAQGLAAGLHYVKGDIVKVKMPMPTTRGGVYERGFVPQVVDDADGKVDLEDEQLLEWRKEQWSLIEARNSLFVLWAAGFAAELKLSRVYVGFQEESEEGSRKDDLDTAAPFIEAVNALLTFGAVSRPVKVVAPFLDLGLDKAAVVQLGQSLEVDFERTYSCEFYPPCDVCGQCTRRVRGLQIS